ncbi:MAG: glycosyltransferase family 2 protein [Meiothermus sp.]|nr:glycosyltransferase family 2 protein [Meiothermus sp.]
MTYLLYAVLAWLGLKLINLLINFLLFPVLRPVKLKGQRPVVSLLVPARNEAHNLRETIPGMLKQGLAEIVILDDGSSDGTATVARRFAEGDARVRLIQGLPKPEGWLGKTWACHQLSQAARGEVLIFTDADVRWNKHGVRAILAQMEAERVAFVSVYPRQITPSVPERVLLPLIDDALLTYLAYPMLATPFPSAAAANGQVMAFSRDAYVACGGHTAVKGEVLEDVRLAQKVKKAGQRMGLALGGDLIGVRMYRAFPEIVEGLGKNLIEFHGRNRLLLGLSWLAHLTAYTLCWPLALLNPWWLLVGGLGLVERLLLNLKTGREWWELVLVPLAPLYAMPVYLRSAARKYTWKGRVYSR